MRAPPVIGKAFWDACTERSKQPSQIHAGLSCVGNSSGDETGRPALVDERTCQLAVFSDKLPLSRQIDCMLHYAFTIRLRPSVVCVFGVVRANARAVAVATRGKESVTKQAVGI